MFGKSRWSKKELLELLITQKKEIERLEEEISLLKKELSILSIKKKERISREKSELVKTNEELFVLVDRVGIAMKKLWEKRGSKR